MTVGVGRPPEIKMNSKERDYQQQLRQAQAQGDGNPFVAGVQEVFEKGMGNSIKGSMTNYGDVTLKPQNLIQGSTSNFEMKDAPANAPQDQPYNQTGSLNLENSMTSSANEGPEDIATTELDKRLRMYAEAGSNAGFGNNDRSQTMRLA